MNRKLLLFCITKDIFPSLIKKYSVTDHDHAQSSDDHSISNARVHRSKHVLITKKTRRCWQGTVCIV